MSAALHNLETLYRTHGHWLTNWLADRTRCRTQASDLAQETFRRLAERPALQLQSHPRRYLATVARRLLIDDVRREAVERGVLDALYWQSKDSTALGPDRIAEAIEQLSILATVLEELPQRVRQAFLMSRLEGLTYAEIGAELGVSSSMVKQYVARALAHCYFVAHGRQD